LNSVLLVPQNIAPTRQQARTLLASTFTTSVITKKKIYFHCFSMNNCGKFDRWSSEMK
jgi:hypothetical protein